jgi:pullulanase/glycogen debranching enzyme
MSWVDWSLEPENVGPVRFTASVIALRAAHPVFRRPRHLTGRPVRSSDLPDVVWLTAKGTEMGEGDSQAPSRLAAELAADLRFEHLEEPEKVVLRFIAEANVQQMIDNVPRATGQ